MFQLTRKIGIVLPAAALVTGAATVQASADITTQPTVTQAQDVPASVAAARGTAPDCIERDVNKKKRTVWITNRCGKTMKVKVVIKNGADSHCRTLSDFETIYYHWYFGTYDRTVTC